MAKIILQKYLSQAGISSRRKAEEHIREGKVVVNGIVAGIGTTIEADIDEVIFHGKIIKFNRDKVYYLLNKPKGYVTTVSDRHAKNKVIDLVPSKTRIWPVGRLDKESRGLIILTNDGDFTYILTHPKFEHEKEYEIRLDRRVEADMLLKLRKGVGLEEGMAMVDKIEKIDDYSLRLVLHQGWKRQIRRMMEKCGYQVVDLKRTRIGRWKLANLKEGLWREIKINKKDVFIY